MTTSQHHSAASAVPATSVSRREMAARIRDIVAQYPEKVRVQVVEADRFAFNLQLITKRLGTSVRLCDVGSGWGTFGLACASVGMNVTIVDDHGDFGFRDEPSMAGMGALYQAYGVEAVSRNVLTQGFGFPESSFDVITTFDCFEHLHNSPRRFAREAVAALRPGGLFIIGVPNCVNLRKRITVPFGLGKWSSMAEWYEEDVFRGHVREPDVEDLRYIARDLGLKNVEIIGRNWKGYNSRFPLVRWATPIADAVLRLRPSLCSDIYMVGVKAK
jgi:2-polyprenyl-3-methyl-5-hydroxy-6-metoxy-1,4-benzoquinol methylase